MQQADCADSTAFAAASGGKIDKVSPSRRGVLFGGLGGAVAAIALAAPVAAVVTPPLAVSSRADDWDRAMASWKAAHAAMRADDVVLDRIYTRYQTATAGLARADCDLIDAAMGYSAANDRNEALADTWTSADSTMMNMPAPHLPALLWKLEKILTIEPDGSTTCWSESAVSQTIADMRRLLGGVA